MFFALLSLAAILAVSCKSIKIDKPVERYDTAAYHPQYSNINIPIEISTLQLKRLVNRKLTGQLFADTSFDDNGGDNLLLYASRKDSIDLGFENGFLTYRVPLKVYMKKRIGASVLGMGLYTWKDAWAEILLKFRTKISINRDWSLSVATLSDGFEWITTPRISVGGFDVPLPYISDLLVKGSLGDIAKGIDKSVRGTVNLRQIVADSWIQMQKPLLISPGDSLWLRLTPAEISSVPLQSKSQVISYALGLKTLVELYYGRQPLSQAGIPLPPLKITSAIGEQFAVNLSLDIPLSYINSLARMSLRGYSVSYGKYKVKLTDVTVYGQGDRLIVEVPVDGSVKGTVYLAGIPAFNKDSLCIEMQDLDFSVASRNVLVKTASWIFHSGLIAKLKSSLVFPIGEQLRSARASTAATLKENRSVENFRINGQVDRLDPEKIRITPSSVKAYFILNGKVKVRMEVE